MICRAQNRRMREFSNGQEVFIRNFGVGSRWISGVIVNSSGPLTWLIKLEDGKTVARHANHIRNWYIQNNDETFQEFKKSKLTTILNYQGLQSCPIKAIIHKQQNRQNQHKTLTIQILPQKKLVKRHWDDPQEFEIDLNIYKTMCDQKVG